MKNKFYDLFPGLSRSNEVYFGLESSLSQTLIKHCTILSEAFKDKELLKKKDVYSHFDKLCQDFGKAVAKDINAERVEIMIQPTTKDFAFTMPLISGANYNRGKNVSDKQFLENIQNDEDILITNDGYKYKNSKGKILIIVICGPLLQNTTPKQMAGIICHEIGHNFQQGIFGTYKMVADNIYAHQLQKIKEVIFDADIPGFPKFLNDIFKFSIIKKLFYVILGTIFFPFWGFLIIPPGIFSKLKVFLTKLGYKDILEPKKFLIKDNKKNINGVGKRVITNSIKTATRDGSITRKDITNDLKDESKIQFEVINKNGTKPEKAYKDTRIWLFRAFTSIASMVNLIQSNILHTLTMTNYTLFEFDKGNFIKKYEFFADIFATSYGFGPELYEGLANAYNNTLKEIDENWFPALKKNPMFRSAYLYHRTIWVDRYMNYDVHGTNYQRGMAQIQSLEYEIKINKSLTHEQRDAILANIEAIKEADKIVHDELKESGFFYRFYNKLIDNRIKKIETRTEEQILVPIQEAYEETCKVNS